MAQNDEANKKLTKVSAFASQVWYHVLVTRPPVDGSPEVCWRYFPILRLIIGVYPTLKFRAEMTSYLVKNIILLQVYFVKQTGF